MRLTRAHRSAGQSLVEFTLVFPLFLMVLFGIIVLGLWVFYNQQTANAAQEGARYAAVHSSSAQCPTVSRLDPIASNQQTSYFRCDPPESGWPRMAARARSFVWAMNPASVSISACWSGFVTPAGLADGLPSSPNVFTDCTIGGVNPQKNPSALACPPPSTTPGTTPQSANGDDKSSALAYVNSTHYPTTVSVYACFKWTPPLAGFLLIPGSITIRQVATEALQRQQ